MKIYQNNRLVATLEKQGYCFNKSNENNQLKLYKYYKLRNDKNKIIGNLVIDTIDSETLEIICRNFKKELKLDNHKIKVVREKDDEMREKEIIFSIKER